MRWLKNCQVFPPCFPQTRFLQKQWWHELVWSVSFVISGSSFCSALTLGLMILELTTGINLHLLVWILSYSFLITLTPLMPFLPQSVQNQTQSSAFVSQKLAEYFQNTPLSRVEPQLLGLWILMGYCLLLIFLPSLIYHIFLSFLLGEKWKLQRSK